PHILGLIDSGLIDADESGSRPFYVMPYIEGESLRQRLDRETQLPVSDTVRIATEIASALDYAHRHGVIHRDIKPENVLLHDGSAIVADFGIALAVSHAGGDRLTQTGVSLGTPAYMSPEQASGERVITQRSDIYSLGVVTYEMLAGEPPFTGSTARVIVAGGFYVTRLARSPDGRRLAYIGRRGAQLLIRPRNQLHGAALGGNEGGASPFFSPDGQRGGALNEGAVHLISLNGGEPITLKSDLIGVAGASWARDGFIYVDGRGLAPLVRVEAKAGADVREFTATDQARHEMDH